MKMDRGQDLCPAQRAKASAEALVPDGEKKPRAKKNPSGQAGSQARRECDLNRLYDLEKVGRTTNCTTDLQQTTAKRRGIVGRARSLSILFATMTTTGCDMVWY